MLKNLLMKMELVEIYSPPYMIETTEQMGSRSGWTLVLTACDKDDKA